MIFLGSETTPADVTGLRLNRLLRTRIGKLRRRGPSFFRFFHFRDLGRGQQHVDSTTCGRNVPAYVSTGSLAGGRQRAVANQDRQTSTPQPPTLFFVQTKADPTPCLSTGHILQVASSERHQRNGKRVAIRVCRRFFRFPLNLKSRSDKVSTQPQTNAQSESSTRESTLPSR